MKVKDLITHILFPSKCAFCGMMINYDKTGFCICGECMNKISFCSAIRRCYICGAPLTKNKKQEYSSTRRLCKNCLSQTGEDNSIFYIKSTSAVVYDEHTKFGIIQFKKSYNLSAVSTFAKMIILMINNDFADVNFDLVVAVPPRKARMRTENFDQASVLAKSVADLINVKFIPNMFKRIRKTQKQSDLNFSDRIRNISGAFDIRKSQKFINNKTILVIDDVSTTGSTLNETARVLKSAGADKVFTATIAKTPGH